MARLLRALGDRGLAASCSINAAAIDVYLACADAIKEAGWELIGHCYEQRALDLETEEEVIRKTIDRIAAFTGEPVQGWQGAGLAACRTEVRENGCGRIAMWRGHGIERLS